MRIFITVFLRALQPRSQTCAEEKSSGVENANVRLLLSGTHARLSFQNIDFMLILVHLQSWTVRLLTAGWRTRWRRSFHWVNVRNCCDTLWPVYVFRGILSLSVVDLSASRWKIWVIADNLFVYGPIWVIPWCCWVWLGNSYKTPP